MPFKKTNATYEYIAHMLQLNRKVNNLIFKELKTIKNIFAILICI